MKLTKIKLTAALVIPLLAILLLASPVLCEDVNVSYKIVSFYEDVTWDDILAFAEHWQAAGITVVEELPMFNTLVLKVPHGVSSRVLADDPRVEAVEDDHKTISPPRVKGQSDSFIQPVQRPPWGHYPWGILRLYDQPFDPEKLTATYRTDWLPKEIKAALNRMRYRKVRIAVFDTGVQYYHDSLYWSTKGGIDLVNEPDRRQRLRYLNYRRPVDDNGHGTYVAGIISAALDRWGNWGQCGTPVDLYAVKILDHQAMGDLSSIIMALHWSINKQIDIVNMSIGFRQDSPSVRRAVKKAGELGIVMVAAVGNRSNWDDNIILSADGGAADGGAADGGAADGGAADGGAADGGAADGGAADGGAADGGAADGGAADGGAADGNGDSLVPFSVMYPARYPEVIGVGAVTPFGDMAHYNNTGLEVDILAPGSGIISADVTNGDKYSGYGVCSGTSQAAAHVTAAIALMLATDASLTPDEVKQILVNTSRPTDELGPGEIDLTAALKQIREEMGYLNRHRRWNNFWYWGWLRFFRR